jgi:putative nucleotidyltransferase with HDIG domain
MIPLLIVGTVILISFAGLDLYMNSTGRPVAQGEYRDVRATRAPRSEKHRHSSEHPQTIEQSNPYALSTNPELESKPSIYSSEDMESTLFTDTAISQAVEYFPRREEGIYHHAGRISRQGWDDLDFVLVSLSNLPADARCLLQVLNDERSSASHVADICEMSVGLTARILKVVNSPFYGLKSRVDTVKNAVALLGYNEIRQIIITSSLFESAKNTGAIDIEGLWNHSIAVGHIACTLADKSAIEIKTDLAGTGSVLHDVGKLVIQRWRPEGFRKAVQLSKEKGTSLLSEELAVLGITHPLAGAMLLERWHLPSTLIKVVKGCHLPVVSADVPEAAVVYVAGQIARLMSIGLDGEQLDERIPDDIRELLGIEAVTVPEMVNWDFEEFTKGTLVSRSGMMGR